MYWMARRPWGRYVGAAGLVVVALVLELSAGATVEHPFLADEVAAGDPITEDDIEWRAVPAGLLDLPDLSTPRARHALAAGTPIVDAVLAADDPVPEGWWSVAVPLPPGVVAGSEVRLVLTTTARSIPGVVLTTPVESAFDFEPTGLVAVPEAEVAPVAAAVAARELTVAVRP